MFDICLASANNKTVMPAFNNLMDGVVKVAASCNKTIDRNDKVTRKMVVAALEEFKFFLMKTYTGSDERRQYDRSRKTAGVVSEFLNNVIDCVPYTTTNAHGSEGTRFRGDFTNSFVRGVDPFQLRNSNKVPRDIHDPALKRNEVMNVDSGEDINSLIKKYLKKGDAEAIEALDRSTYPELDEITGTSGGAKKPAAKKPTARKPAAKKPAAKKA